MTLRQIFLDTERTGLSAENGARVIEIGCVEMINRKLTGRHYHQYINPQRKVDEGAMEVHGITDQFLEDKPTYDAIVEEFMAFIKGAELVIHNAPFDIGFLKAAAIKTENNWPDYIIVDTVRIARSALGRDEVQDCKLSTLAEFFGASIEPNHRALDDARATVDVLHGIFERLGTFGVSTLGELTTFKRKRERKALG